MVRHYHAAALMFLAAIAGCDNGGSQQAEGGGGDAVAQNAAPPAGAQPPAPAGGGAVAALDACSLLTPEEIAAVIGKEVEAGQSGMALPGGGGTAQMSDCTWQTPAAPVDPNNLDVAAAIAGTAVVTLSVWAWPDTAGAERYVQSFRDVAGQLPGAGPTEPVDVGDEAVWATMAAPIGGSLHVRGGDKTFSISVTAPGSENPDAQAQTQQLAETVLTRL